MDAARESVSSGILQLREAADVFSEVSGKSGRCWRTCCRAGARRRRCETTTVVVKAIMPVADKLASGATMATTATTTIATTATTTEAMTGSDIVQMSEQASRLAAPAVEGGRELRLLVSLVALRRSVDQETY